MEGFVLKLKAIYSNTLTSILGIFFFRTEIRTLEQKLEQVGFLITANPCFYSLCSERGSPRLELTLEQEVLFIEDPIVFGS